MNNVSPTRVEPLDYTMGVIRLFCAADVSTRGLLSGWAVPEESHVWNEGIDAMLTVAARAPAGVSTLTIEGEPYLSKRQPFQDMTVFANGHRAAFWRLGSRDDSRHSMEIEPEWWLVRGAKGFLKLTFHLPCSIRPSEAEGSPDARQLGFCFRSFVISDPSVVSEPMTRLRIEGQIGWDEQGRIEGWCWSPDRPDERMIVELVADDAVVLAIAAARYRSDLRVDGIRDGSHGFSVALPEAILRGACLISAREAGTGVVFGRLDLRGPATFAPVPPRLRQIADTLEAAAGLVARERTREGPEVAHAFRALGDRLSAGVGEPSVVQLAMATLRRRFPRLTLRRPERPVAGLIVQAAPDVAATYATLEALSRFHAVLDLRTILVDDGTDPLTALLGLRVDGLVTAYGAGRAEAARLDAIGLAGCERLVFVDAASELVPIEALRAVLEDEAPLILGPALLRSAIRIGALDAIAPQLHALARRGAPRLVVDRAALDLLGGFDDGLAGAGDLDLALKARLAGLPVVALAEPPRGGPARAAVPFGEEEAALVRRWGLTA